MRNDSVGSGRESAAFLCHTHEKRTSFEVGTIGRELLPAIFVHLSDIHFGQEKDGGQYRVNDDAKARLIDDAATEIARRGLKASGVIVTGDIAYAAKKQQYDDAGRWLDRLTAAIGCERTDIQMVPGNHDIDRDAITPAIRWQIEAIIKEGDSTLDLLLDDEASREALFTRFGAYRDFSDGYGCVLDCGGELSSDGVVELAPGRSIRFVRLNSALICSKSDDKGKLMLGKRQRVLPTSSGEEVIVLVHHPLNWFQDSDDARRYIQSRARVLISGHEHFPSVQMHTVEEGCDLLMLAAGATAPDYIADGYTYKYNILEFDWDEEADGLSVTINPRTWDDEHKRFSTDHEFLNGRSTRCVLSAPNFRRGKEPQKGISPSAIVRVEVTPQINPVAQGGSAVLPIVAGEKLLRLRFFRDLTEGQRLNILADVDAIPAEMHEKVNNAIEQTLFHRAVRMGKAGAIQVAIDAMTGK